MITNTPLEPMALVLVEQPFDDPNCLYQIKWDGVRMVTYLDESGLLLFNRKQRERTANYPELQEIKTAMKARSAILDGEIVALGEGGKPDFSNILKRDLALRSDKIASLVRKIPIYYLVFDLLYLDGRWLIDLPLTARQERLEDALRPTAHVQLVANHSSGVQLFNLMREQGMEGIVIKEKAGSYHIGERHPTWKKVKNFRTLFAVVGGVSLRGGQVNSLLLGLYQEGRLHYIGKAGSGLTGDQLRALTAFVGQLPRQPHPFASLPQLTAGTRYDQIAYLPPQLVVEVQFLEWTSDLTLRAPSVRGFRERDPRSCIF
ncbi:non-homologous end-joining DNA ligase [Tumebacillus lipolyticus]|uniref:DNA ligase (ATP) n=1 Tax=Tumebacillus lipolyticus TaxID=1280370 RepID=A0ABW4ZRQ3_9BACL